MIEPAKRQLSAETVKKIEEVCNACFSEGYLVIGACIAFTVADGGVVADNADPATFDNFGPQTEPDINKSRAMAWVNMAKIVSMDMAAKSVIVTGD